MGILNKEDKMLLNNLKTYCEGNKTALKFIELYVKNKENINQGGVEHILDFIKNSEIPIDIDNTSYRSLEKKTKKWVENNISSVIDVDLGIDDMIPVYSSGNLMVYKLLTKKALQVEGKLMNQCVGGYDPNRTDIYSIKDDNLMSHATIEVCKDNVNQVKGRGNGSVNPKYINIILEFLELIGKKVRESEMKYLGYISISKEEKKLLQENFIVDILDFDDKDYLYVNKKIKRL